MPERQSDLCVIGMAGREAMSLEQALMARWRFKHAAGIARLLKSGASWTQVQAATGCSRATIAKIAKRAALTAPRHVLSPPETA